MANFPVRFVVQLTKPADPGQIGNEAMELVYGISELSKDELEKITQPILDGFAHNFETESAAGEPWPLLAKWTQREREELMDGGLPLVPGFGPEHPILQRTGEYKRSWIERSHREHVEEVFKEFAFTSLGAQVGINITDIDIGSKDERVVKLSGGLGEQPGLILDEEGTPISEGTLGPPPRRVDIISQVFVERSKRAVTFILDRKAEKVD